MADGRWLKSIVDVAVVDVFDTGYSSDTRYTPRQVPSREGTDAGVRE